MFILGSEFDVSFLSRILQSDPAAISPRLYISTVFEQQAHNLQRPTERGQVQRDLAEQILDIQVISVLRSSSNRRADPPLKRRPTDAQSNSVLP